MDLELARDIECVSWLPCLVDYLFSPLIGLYLVLLIVKLINRSITAGAEGDSTRARGPHIGWSGGFAPRELLGTLLMMADGWMNGG